MVVAEQKLNAFSRAMDGIATAISPRWRFSREQWRDALSRFSAYRAMARIRENRRLSASADATTLPYFEAMRDGARDRERNDPHVKAILKVLRDHIVGTGIIPQSRPDRRLVKLTDEQARQWSADCESFFAEEVPHLDVTGELDFYDQQGQVFERVFVDGDFFVQRTKFKSPKRSISTTFELIEGDRICDPYGVSREQIGDDVTIRAGVQLGRRHQAIAYWVALEHPDDHYDGISTSKKKIQDRVNYRRVRAFEPNGQWNMLRLFRPERRQQTRGISHLGNCLPYLKILDDYLEAELDGKRAESCIAYARERTLDGAIPGVGKYEPNDVDELEDVYPGKIYDLAPGEKIHLMDPSRPGNTFDMFVKRILLAAGASIRVPYLFLSMDYENTSFTSSRAAGQDFWRHCQGWHKWLSHSYCQPVWDLVIREAVWRGRLRPPVPFDGNEYALTRVEWMPQKRDYIEPQKDATADQIALQTGAKTLKEILAARGRDYGDHLDQLVTEKEDFENRGLPPIRTGEAHAADDTDDEPETETEDDDADEGDRSDDDE